jgi:hypothetical protein
MQTHKKIEKYDLYFPPKCYVSSTYILKNIESGLVVGYACELDSIINSKWWQKKILAGVDQNSLSFLSEFTTDTQRVFAVRGIDVIVDGTKTSCNINLLENFPYYLTRNESNVTTKIEVAIQQMFVNKNNKTGFAVLYFDRPFIANTNNKKRTHTRRKPQGYGSRLITA